MTVWRSRRALVSISLVKELSVLQDMWDTERNYLLIYLLT